MEQPSRLELPAFRPLGGAQARALRESARLHGLREEARARLDRMAGTLAWRPVRGVPHLVLTGPAGPSDRRTRTRILGPRDARTEALAASAPTERARAEADLREADEAIAMQAAANRSARLGTIPVEAARALRALDGTGTLAVGAAALCAYAARAGLGHVPGAGSDPLRPLAERLGLAGRDAPGTCRILRAAGGHGFSARSPSLAVGPEGYLLDCAPPGSFPESFRASPPLRVVCIDLQGFPVAVACPPQAAYVAERLARGQDGDADAGVALAQGRAAVACLPAQPRAGS